MNLAEELENIYNDACVGPFPYKDCRWLADHVGLTDSELTPEVDHYFGTVAGYASSATRLSNRAPTDLAIAKTQLEKGFFEWYPNLEVCRLLIDPKYVPEFHRQMIAIERLRVGLLQLLDTLPK